MKYKKLVNCIKKRKKIVFTIVFIVMTFLVVVFYFLSTKSGIMQRKPYDKHLGQYSTDMPLHDICLQDLQFIYEEIRDNYVNLKYKEELLGFDWDDEYEYYSGQINSSTQKKDFYKICNEFISILKDGHVWFDEYNIDAKKRIWAPYTDGFTSAFTIRLIEGRPVIIANRIHEDLNGYEVLSINDIEFTDIINSMLKYCYRSGNDISAITSLFVHNDFYRYFIYNNMFFPDELVYTLVGQDGIKKSITIEANISFENNYLISSDINMGVKINELPTYKIIDDIGYIRLDTFDGKVKDIVSEFDDIVKKLKKEKVIGVIIDVRNNGGGNESFRKILGYLTRKEINIVHYHYKKSKRYNDIYYLRDIYETLLRDKADKVADEGYTKWMKWTVKPSKQEFLNDVPVVVLCNESILSSTSNFVYACMDHELATVIGNMVPLSGHGMSTQVVLPSGEFVISYSMHEAIAPDGTALENNVIRPDIIASLTYNDLINNVDTQLERGLKYIRDTLDWQF